MHATALLLTDVVDSTALAERLGDAAMAELWRRHDDLARALLAEWRGSELDRSDGLLMRFDSVDDAAGCALALHRALAGLAEPLALRAGIHVGIVHRRENPTAHVALGAKLADHAGLAIAVVSRVTSLAGPGQTLLTADARRQLTTAKVRIHDHGSWRLKGIESPFEVFEVADATTMTAPLGDAPKAYRVVRRGDLWVPHREVPTTLPAERSTFVGRTDALAWLAERVRGGARLVSLVGPAGSGKTRLALRFGWQWLGDFEGGAWFCDLSQARTLDGVLAAVAQGLQVPLGTVPPMEQLGAALAGRGRCLVVLDNFEQVVAHARDTVGRWLDRAPEAHFVVTTSTVLAIDGEQLLAVAPMRPDEGKALFVARARAARRDFEPESAEARKLDGLVELRDGLPLAIALAAARVRIMSVDALAARMKERFQLLARAGGGRHATLRAALDWSWDLLDGTEREALAELSVFEGGFDLHGFEAVVRTNEPDRLSLDLLQSLVDKSWVQQASDVRFDMLRSVQAYARERLDERGDDAVRGAERRHWQFVAAHGASPAGVGAVVDLDNFVEACRRATAAGDSSAAAATLEAAWGVLNLCGPFQAIEPLARGVAEMPGLSTAARALVCFVVGSVELIFGARGEAERSFEEGLAHARAAEDIAREVLLLCQLAEVRGPMGRLREGLDALQLASELAERLSNPHLRYMVLNSLGTLHFASGRLDEAYRAYGGALATARMATGRGWEGALLGNLGVVARDLGRLEEARGHYERALELLRETGAQRWEGNTRCNLGLLLNDLGDAEGARVHLDAALASARRLGQRRLECVVLLNLGELVEGAGRLEAARRLYADALVIARAIADVRRQGQCLAALGAVEATLRLATADDTLVDARRQLAAVDDRLSLALLVCRMAEIAADSERNRDAATLLREADSLVATLGVVADSPIGKAHARASSAVARGAGVTSRS